MSMIIDGSRKRSKKSKTYRVLRHLQTKGSINTWDSIMLYRATRLSAIIYNLREQGHTIKSKETYNGKGSPFVEYYYYGKG